MSVEVIYNGGIGNCLFQYVCARLFAIQNNLKLTTPFKYQDIFQMTPFEGGKQEGGPKITIEDKDDPLSRPFAPANYSFLGYFQRSKWYTSRREEIENFMQLKPISAPALGGSNIVLHLRMGDFVACKIAIHPSWYLNILRKEDFERLVIVTNEVNPEYISHFSIYNPVVVCSTPAHDWYLVRQFDKIICSNSTFCWWAAFLSRASRIYTFKRWIGNSGMDISWLPNSIELDGPFLHEG